jgi:hypothetical protein
MRKREDTPHTRAFPLFSLSKRPEKGKRRKKEERSKRKGSNKKKSSSESFPKDSLF